MSCRIPQGWIILSSDAMCNLTGTFKMWILYDLYTFSVLSCIHYILSLASYIFIRPLIRLHIFVPSTYYVFQVIIIYMNMFQNYVQNPSEYNNNRVAATLAPPLVHTIHAMYIVHRYIVYEYAMAIYVLQDSLYLSIVSIPSPCNTMFVSIRHVKGSFINYVAKILPFFDHLPTSTWTF